MENGALLFRASSQHVCSHRSCQESCFSCCHSQKGKSSVLSCRALPASVADESCLLLCMAGAGLRDQTQVMEPSLECARLGLPCAVSKHPRRRRKALAGVTMWQCHRGAVSHGQLQKPPLLLACSASFLLGWCLCRGVDSHLSPL